MFVSIVLFFDIFFFYEVATPREEIKFTVVVINTFSISNVETYYTSCVSLHTLAVYLVATQLTLTLVANYLILLASIISMVAILY